jgi:hypothetical protein
VEFAPFENTVVMALDACLTKGKPQATSRVFLVIKQLKEHL